MATRRFLSNNLCKRETKGLSDGERGREFKLTLTRMDTLRDRGDERQVSGCDSPITHGAHL